MFRFVLVVSLVALTSGVGTQGALTYDAPEGWTSAEPRSTMRVAEFVLPRAEGDREDASLVVYYFGGAGGSVDANLERWLSQMAQPDGRSSRDVARTRTIDSNGLSVTVLEVAGTYVAEVRPGAPERHRKPGFRLLAAVVETPDGPYFVKLTGPEQTVDRWNASVTSFLESFRYQ